MFRIEISVYLRYTFHIMVCWMITIRNNIYLIWYVFDWNDSDIWDIIDDIGDLDLVEDDSQIVDEAKELEYLGMILWWAWHVWEYINNNNMKYIRANDMGNVEWVESDFEFCSCGQSVLRSKRWSKVKTVS